MKKIFIIAYCRTNLGDDLFVQTLLRRYPNVQFYLPVNPNYNTAFVNEKNLEYPSFLCYQFMRVGNKIGFLKQFTRFQKYKNQADAIIQIGGSIFMEPINWNPTKTKVNIEPNTYYIGANFGPYKSKSYLEITRKYIASSQDCCFRDMYSYNLFKDIPGVRYAPDVLLSCDFNLSMKKVTGIGISVIELENRKVLNDLACMYYETIAKLCDLAYEIGTQVTLFSFCAHEGDERAIKKIKSMVKQKTIVNECCYHGNTNQFLTSLNQCEYILATRFHAMIIGWKLRKKVFPIVYSRKQTNVMKDIGYTGDSWDLQKKQHYPPKQLLSDCLNSKILNIDSFEKEAEKQFATVDKLLK